MLFRARSGESRLVLLPQYFVISSKSSSNFKKRVTCLLSAWPGPFVLSTCGDIQQPVLVAVCDGGQTSGFCPHQSHHRGVGWRHKRRWAQPVPQHRAPIKAQGTWLHLTANIWERLGSPAATGSLSQNPSSKRRGKNKISGWRRSLDVRNVYTPVSFISFLCTRTHLADRTAYEAEDELGRSGRTKRKLFKFCRLDERLTQFTSLFWTFPAAYVQKCTAQLSSLSAFLACLLQHLQLDKISGMKGKEVTTGESLCFSVEMSGWRMSAWWEGSVYLWKLFLQ